MPFERKQEQNLLKTCGQFETLSNRTLNVNLKVLPPLFKVDVPRFEIFLKFCLGTKARYFNLKVCRNIFF